MICILSGTNRPGSKTLQVAQLLRGYYQKLWQSAITLNLLELPAELFEPEAYAHKPASFTGKFVEPVLNCSGLHVVTPEYNGSFPGVLKLFIDMLPFPEAFEGRPVAFTGLSAGTSGALRPVEQLQMVFAYRNAHLFPKRVFLPGISKLLPDNGDFSDPAMTIRLEEQCKEFVRFQKMLGSL
jgi:chromate reductase, NAD(P)H dehydrogenase (quinone)